MLTNPKWPPLLLDRLGREKKKKLWKSLYYIFFETMMLCWTRSTNLISFLQGLREPAHGRGSGGHPAWSLLSEEFQASEGHFTDRYGVHKNRCIRNSDPANFQKSKRLVLPRSQGQQTSVTSTAPLSFLCPTRHHWPSCLPSSDAVLCRPPWIDQTRQKNQNQFMIPAP